MIGRKTEMRTDVMLLVINDVQFCIFALQDTHASLAFYPYIILQLASTIIDTTEAYSVNLEGFDVVLETTGPVLVDNKHSYFNNNFECVPSTSTCDKIQGILQLKSSETSGHKPMLGSSSDLLREEGIKRNKQHQLLGTNISRNIHNNCDLKALASIVTWIFIFLSPFAFRRLQGTEDLDFWLFGRFI
eukprot:Gb_07072 [translate_table: standard]